MVPVVIPKGLSCSLVALSRHFVRAAPALIPLNGKSVERVLLVVGRRRESY